MGEKWRQRLQGMKETLGNKRLRKTEKRALRASLNKGAEMRGDHRKESSKIGSFGSNHGTMPDLNMHVIGMD